MYYNIVTNKYKIGDIYCCDIEKVIRGYIEDNNTKFYTFTIRVSCKLDKEDINISIDDHKGSVSLYKFEDGEWFCYNYCKSKQIRDYIFHRAMLSGIKLDSSSIINNLTITLFSKYKSMAAKHRIQQPRRVLESKVIKHIKNASYNDKTNKYNFLTLAYELLF